MVRFLDGATRVVGGPRTSVGTPPAENAAAPGSGALEAAYAECGGEGRSPTRRKALHLARFLLLRDLGKRLLLLLRLDDLRHGVGISVLELRALEVVPAHRLHQRERALDLIVGHLGRQRQQLGRAADSSGQRIACSTITSSRTRSRPSRSRPDHAYFATATFDDRPSACTSSLYGFAATCPSGSSPHRCGSGRCCRVARTPRSRWLSRSATAVRAGPPR